jgi:hypothetical protein
VSFALKGNVPEAEATFVVPWSISTGVRVIVLFERFVPAVSQRKSLMGTDDPVTGFVGSYGRLGAEHGRQRDPARLRAARRGRRPPPARLGRRHRRPRFPAVAALLVEAEADLLAHYAFPEGHRRQIRSTNPLERLNREIKRRTGVVGIFATRASVIRLVGMILAEQDDEWQDGRRYFRPETMALIDATTEQEVGQPLLMAS